MKNLLVYISPTKQLRPEHKLMLEVQIENSLDYWKPEDIVLAFNFPYEYKGIKAIEVPDLINNQFSENPRAIINSKIDTIIYLLENKIITELTWFHDFDSFQLAPFNVSLEKDLGLVRYGVYPERNLKPLPGVDNLKRINCGNIFFKHGSLDIFKRVLEKMDKEKLFEEDALTLMLDEIKHQIMNQTYNISPRSIRRNCKVSEKPIKIAHFPPHRHQWFRKIKVLLPQKLINLINKKFNYATILVTGMNGFIGSNILAYLKKRGYNAAGIDEDIRDIEALRPYFKNINFVIHTAAQIRKVRDAKYWDVNVVGTKNVARLCITNRCKMIHFGSVITDHTYGQTKRVSEMVVEEYVKRGLKAVTLRLNPIYSKDMTPTPGIVWYPLEKLMKDIEKIIKTHNFDNYKLIEKPPHIHQS